MLTTLLLKVPPPQIRSKQQNLWSQEQKTEAALSIRLHNSKECVVQMLWSLRTVDWSWIRRDVRIDRGLMTDSGTRPSCPSCQRLHGAHWRRFISHLLASTWTPAHEPMSKRKTCCIENHGGKKTAQESFKEDILMKFWFESLLTLRYSTTS